MGREGVVTPTRHSHFPLLSTLPIVCHAHAIVWPIWILNAKLTALNIHFINIKPSILQSVIREPWGLFLIVLQNSYSISFPCFGVKTATGIWSYFSIYLMGLLQQASWDVPNSFKSRVKIEMRKLVANLWQKRPFTQVHFTLWN